ncbi:MAG TPA: hypothetical protein PK280_16410 [Planctomycetota bacterium]|nr:hypothetical protein [Planctomycetota bacterium]
MIEINLLPPEHRPVERTPLPRLLTILGGVLLTAAGVVIWVWLSMVSIPKAKQRCEDRRQAMEKAKKDEAEVLKIEQELKAAKDRQDVLNELFNQRVSWAKVLDRLAEARAGVKGLDDVVLTRVEFKKSGGSAPGRKGAAEVRQLFVQAFVSTNRKEANAGELREVGLAFIKSLCADSAFKQDFECEENGEQNAKYTYLGDQMVENASKPGAAAGRGAKDAPAATLNFEVLFTFKPPPVVNKPAAGPQPAQPPVAAAGK